MFDIGFSELIVIAIVALVVIGPERLPKVARTAGLLLGRLQRYVSDVKADISREIQLDELKKLQSEMHESVREFESTVTQEMAVVEKSVEETAQSARMALDDATKSLNETIAAAPAEVPSPAAPDLSDAPAAPPASAPERLAHAAASQAAPAADGAVLPATKG